MIAELPKHYCWHCYGESGVLTWESFTQRTEPNATHYDDEFAGLGLHGFAPERNWYCEKHWRAMQEYKAKHTTFNEATRELNTALFRLIEPLLASRRFIVVLSIFVALLAMALYLSYGR